MGVVGCYIHTGGGRREPGGKHGRAGEERRMRAAAVGRFVSIA